MIIKYRNKIILKERHFQEWLLTLLNFLKSVICNIVKLNLLL